MAFDLSILSNIDFSNRDTLIFIAIFFVIFLAIIFAVIFIFQEVIRNIKKLIIRTFNIDVKRPDFDQKIHIESLERTQNDNDIFNKKNTGVNFNNGKITSEIKIPSRPESSMVPKPVSSVKNEIKIPVSEKAPDVKVTPQKDDSIFHGETEVSKAKLEHALRTDSKAWQAARETGLNISPVERAKLVKEVFSSAYGRNISKTDLKSGIRKLNQKMLGAKGVEEHTKLRKQIKFFKKIGGIK